MLTAAIDTNGGNTVNFTASATDADGVAGYQWFFGDLTRSPVLTANGNVSHTYDTTGTYQALCYVADALGSTAYKSFTITVRNTSTPVINDAKLANAPTELSISTGKGSLVLSGSNLRNSILELFAMDGRLIKSIRSTTGDSQIRLDAIKNGSYVYRIREATGNHTSGTILLY